MRRARAYLTRATPLIEKAPEMDNEYRRRHAAALRRAAR
jgi:hypothetical protein